MNFSMNRDSVFFLLVTLVLFFTSAAGSADSYSVTLAITSELPKNLGYIPMDSEIDFGALIRKGRLSGVLDPNSIQVVDKTDGRIIPHARGEDFAYNGDKGKVMWVIEDPTHRTYEIRFQTAQKRPALEQQKYVPMIGTGDLLRYNTDKPGPISLIEVSRTADLTGDGRQDLLGAWVYAHHPDFPWGGIFCHPRIGTEDKFEFGDLIRLRTVSKPGSKDFKFVATIYNTADFADFDNDGLVDMVSAPSGYSNYRGKIGEYETAKNIYFYRNTGKRDKGGMPIFANAGILSNIRKPGARGVRAVDLNNDGLTDLVSLHKTVPIHVGADPQNIYLYLKNTNPNGFPFKPGKPVYLKLGDGLCFYDVDGDGFQDAITLKKIVGARGVHEYKVVWGRNLGGDPPRFSKPQRLEGVDPFWPASVAPAQFGSKRGLLVQHDQWQRVSFFEQVEKGKKPRFKKGRLAVSHSARLSLSDQAAEVLCDWDDDGDLDMLVGDGYGWPRVVINDGTTKRPEYRTPQKILADGKGIRLLRNEILGEPDCWHNMGYPFPAFIDWDADGLRDLILPNETNRIFWYKNIGTKKEPKFGKQQQIIVDGYPDSPAIRAKSARLVAAKKPPYPKDKASPFAWRCGAGFADFNGDGLMDMVTKAGSGYSLTLFLRYHDKDGVLRLKEAKTLKTVSGKQFSGRRTNVIDWDGDGLLDIIFSRASTQSADADVIFLARNVGTNADPIYEEIRALHVFGEHLRVMYHGPHPWVGDVDGDGKPDILPYTEWSVFPFFRHAAIEMKERPQYRLGRAKKQ